MYNYIYELLPAPRPANEWTRAWEYHECPDAFPIADNVEEVKDRDSALKCFGAWLKEKRLGELTDERLTIDAQAADRYFDGRFGTFQQAIEALRQLRENQFIHEHDRVQWLIYDLIETFTRTYGDYVLWYGDLAPVPLEEFLRKVPPGETYYIGAVFTYKH